MLVVDAKEYRDDEGAEELGRSLVHRCGSKGRSVGALELSTQHRVDVLEAADSAIEAFYSAMEEQARADRQQREAFGMRASQSKHNREQIYLDPRARDSAKAESRAFIRRQVEVLRALDRGKLRGRIAMQHFISIDVDDLYVQPCERRSDDEFHEEPGPTCNVCQQLLLDASRGAYTVSGQHYDFNAEMEASGVDLEEAPDEVERMKEAFTERVVCAVRRCLASAADQDPPAMLLRATTMLITQSGLASVERACGPWPQYVVSGGEQQVRFTLSAVDTGLWELELCSEKRGFSSCFRCESTAANEELLECGEDSLILRSAKIHVSLRPDGKVLVDVCDLTEKIMLNDMFGRPHGQRNRLLTEAPADVYMPPIRLRPRMLALIGVTVRYAVRASVNVVKKCTSVCKSGLTLASRWGSRALGWPAKSQRRESLTNGSNVCAPLHEEGEDLS